MQWLARHLANALDKKVKVMLESESGWIANLLPRAESTKIVDSFWTNISKELHDDPSNRDASNRNVKEDPWSFDSHSDCCLHSLKINEELVQRVRITTQKSNVFDLKKNWQGHFYRLPLNLNRILGQLQTIFLLGPSPMEFRRTDTPVVKRNVSFLCWPGSLYRVQGCLPNPRTSFLSLRNCPTIPPSPENSHAGWNTKFCSERVNTWATCAAFALRRRLTLGEATYTHLVPIVMSFW